MDTYSKIVDLTSSPTVTLCADFKDLLHTELCLGMTRYVCRNGTLSAGHEKVTTSQRYYQAVKECYGLAQNIKSQKVIAMEAQADLLDAQEMDEHKEASKLRKQAAIMRAVNKLEGALVTIEDQMRQLDEFNKVRMELMAEVKAKYPLGIEQAEEDNWKAVAKYRYFKKAMGYSENLTHIPLPMDEQAKLGIEMESPDLMAWKLTVDQKGLGSMADQFKKLEKLEGKLNG